MNRVLIVDDTPYGEELAGVFAGAGYAVDVCETAFDAMAKLKAYDFDLFVSEVELPGDNAFDLYNYISTYYPYIPAIMTTAKDIDDFFDRIFQEGIGNVLGKPANRNEILSLARRLITKQNIYGLQNYIDAAGGEIKKIRISSSKQIRSATNMALDYIENWGFMIGNKAVLSLILHEMIINAVYHSHGYTREKEMRIPVTLAANEYVDLFFAYGASGYGISITDYKGRLSKMKILDSIHKAIEQSHLILRAAETGEDISEMVSETGRGIDLVRKLSAEYYFIIKKDVRTEIILLFGRGPGAGNASSLRIIEEP